MRLSPSYRFDGATVSLSLGHLGTRVRIVPEGDRLVGRIGDEEVFRVPFDPEAMLDLGLLPMETGGGTLAVGQSWVVPTLDFGFLRPVHVAERRVKVKEREEFVWADGVCEAFHLVWGEDVPGAPETWVDRRGRVLLHRQEGIEVALFHYEEGEEILKARVVRRFPGLR